MTKNRTRRFLGSLLSAAALVSLAPVADIALAPAAHAASVWNVAEAPYVHSDILGRRWHP